MSGFHDMLSPPPPINSQKGEREGVREKAGRLRFSARVRERGGTAQERGYEAKSRESKAGQNPPS